MDKNTLIGLLLMGLLIFGMSWCNRPSEEQLRQQQEAIELAQREQAKADSIAAASAGVVDTLVASDISNLRTIILQAGTDSTGAARIAGKDFDLRVADNAVKGTVAAGDTVVPFESVVARTLPPAVQKEAIASINKVLRYRTFARFMTGDSSSVRLENDLMAIDIASRGGAIARVELKKFQNYRKADTTNVILFDGEDNRFNFTLNTGTQFIDTESLNFTTHQENDSTVVASLDLGGGSTWAINYTLPRNSYAVKMEVKQTQMQNIIPTNISSMEFEWFQRMPRQERGRTFEERNSTIYYQFAGDDVEYLNEMKANDENVSERIKWIGFKNQYFSSVMIAKGNFSKANLVTKPFEKGSGDPRYEDYLKELDAKTTLEYNSTAPVAASFDLYFGPNDVSLLDDYDEMLRGDGSSLKLARLVPLGWSLFRWINEYIIIPVFNFFGSFVSNYGIVILLLTLFIKLIIFPLTYKSLKSQAKMRVLAPDIKEINEKYPGNENAMTRQQKTMELYSKAGASPMSGCLPMLLQMPILIAAFTFFPSAIALRGESFLWATDLSAPDVVLTLPFSIPWYGNQVSLFCLLMTATNIIYSYLNMQTQGGGSMPSMKWMMYLMPVMFLFFFNDYASGLSYYYFLSLLITIIMTYAFRAVVKEEDVRAEMARNAANKKGKKKSGFMARLEEAQRRQQAMLREQQKKNGKR